MPVPQIKLDAQVGWVDTGNPTPIQTLLTLQDSSNIALLPFVSLTLHALRLFATNPHRPCL